VIDPGGISVRPVSRTSATHGAACGFAMTLAAVMSSPRAAAFTAAWAICASVLPELIVMSGLSA
jgi:hypothetical protein